MDISAYMIYLEGPEYLLYAMQFFYLKFSGTPKYGNTLGNYLPVGPAQQTTENYQQYSGCSEQRNVLCICFAYSIPRDISGNNIQQHGILGGFIEITSLIKGAF